MALLGLSRIAGLVAGALGERDGALGELERIWLAFVEPHDGQRSREPAQ